MASLKKRGKTYYIQFYRNGNEVRKSLNTASYQVAKEKLRQFESALARGNDDPLPTRTPIAQVVTAYVEHIRQTKTRNGYKVDLWYLRELFGPLCPELALPDDRKRREHLDARCFEDISTAQVSEFIARLVRERGYAPKTANRYREVVQRVFNWSMSQRGIRMPNEKNPAAKVERYKERARTIRFLTLEQIDEQLRALEDRPQLQTIAAVYIYAGLRREEALWLTRKDIDLKSGPYGVIHVCAKTVNDEFWEPKTKVNRVVPVSAALRACIDRWQPPIVPGHWYFPSPQGCRWDPDNFSQALRAANNAARLPWSCLDYRHTFGSQLAMKGESLYKIATLMGNSPEVCRRHYAALMPEALHGSVEFMSTPSGSAPVALGVCEERRSSAPPG